MLSNRTTVFGRGLFMNTG